MQDERNETLVEGVDRRAEEGKESSLECARSEIRVNRNARHLAFCAGVLFGALVACAAIWFGAVYYG